MRVQSRLDYEIYNAAERMIDENVLVLLPMGLVLHSEKSIVHVPEFAASDLGNTVIDTVREMMLS